MTSSVEAVRPALLLFAGEVMGECDSAELAKLWIEMYDLACNDPAFGCVGHESYAAGENKTFGLYRFATMHGLQAFGRDPRHRQVQARSHEFFSKLEITVVSVAREYESDLAGFATRAALGESAQ